MRRFTAKPVGGVIQYLDEFKCFAALIVSRSGMNPDVRDTSADSHLSYQKPCTEAKMTKDLMQIQISAMMSTVASERTYVASSYTFEVTGYLTVKFCSETYESITRQVLREARLHNSCSEMAFRYQMTISNTLRRSQMRSECYVSGSKVLYYSLTTS